MSFKNNFTSQELSETINLEHLCNRHINGHFKNKKDPFIRVFKFKVSELKGETRVHKGAYVDFDFFNRDHDHDRVINEARLLFKSDPNKLEFKLLDIIEDIAL